MSLVAIGPLSHDSKSSSLSAKEYEMKINLEDLARANNGKSFFKKMMTDTGASTSVFLLLLGFFVM